VYSGILCCGLQGWQFGNLAISERTEGVFFSKCYSLVFSLSRYALIRDLKLLQQGGSSAVPSPCFSKGVATLIDCCYKRLRTDRWLTNCVSFMSLRAIKAFFSYKKRGLMSPQGEYAYVQHYDWVVNINIASPSLHLRKIRLTYAM
jgi:hypothetical protein